MIDSTEFYLLIRAYIALIAPALVIMLAIGIWVLIKDERKHR